MRGMKTHHRLGYWLLLGVLECLAMLPWRVLYLLSDFASWVMHSVVGYRRRVVHDNLTSSFPEKSAAEIARIEREFYRWLTDYGFETVKMLRMSPRVMMRRLEVANAGMVNDAVARGRSVVLCLGHYCNWEWVSSLPLHFSGREKSAQVYHYLHSRVMDEIFMKIRTRYGANNIEMRDIMQQLVAWKRAGDQSVTGFIADQCPHLEMHLFVDFLHHDTGVYTGPERIARFLDAEVLFCHLSRRRRGYYRLEFVKITDTPKREETFAITRRYFEMLEANIRQAPQYWLWSHRRWKRTRADFMAYWGDQAERQLSHL